jgi:hypothetical protein
MLEVVLVLLLQMRSTLLKPSGEVLIGIRQVVACKPTPGRRHAG